MSDGAGKDRDEADQAVASDAALVATLNRIQAELSDVCARLDPNTIGLARVESVFDRFCRIQKLASGGVTRLAPRYKMATTGKPGVPDPDENLGRKMGTSKGKAKRRARTGQKASESGPLGDALGKGTLSDEQAELLAQAADHLDEDDIAELTTLAGHASTSELRVEIARRRAANEDDTARAKRLHARRRLSRWQDADGAWNAKLTCAPGWGAEITARLTPVVDRIFRAACSAGRREHPDAYAADALYELLTGEPAPNWGGSPSSVDAEPAAGVPAEQGRSKPSARRGSQAVRPDRKVIVNVDLGALLRGSTEPGETCEIAGIGPVAVSEASAMLGDSFLAVVIRDGVDIRNVTHLGRRVTAVQRTALEARGYECEVPGCTATHRLEIDHVDDWAESLQTVLDALAWLCPAHHRMKTRKLATLDGPPGERVWHETTRRRSGDPPRAGPDQANLFTTAT